MSKKGKKVEELEGEKLEDELLRWELRVAELQAVFVRRTEEVEAARAEEQELREKCKQLEEAFAEAKRERHDIVADFTRQQKATEDEMIARITILDSTIADLNDQRELSDLALKETEKERQQLIEMKQREWDEQNKKLIEMEKEFNVMLETTQKKMQEKVSSTMIHRDDGDDDEGDA